MPGWLTIPRNPLSHTDKVMLHPFTSRLTPGSVLTGEVVEAVAVHQPPVPVTAVCVVSHNTNLAVVNLLLLLLQFLLANKPLSSFPLHPQKMFQRRHQIVHNGFGELL